MRETLIDTIVERSRGDNLTVKQCKAWWENQMDKEYFKSLSWNLSQPQLYARIPLTKSSCILEIGCGYGRQLSQFVEISNYVYGIDITKGAVKLAKENVPTAIVVEYDGTNIPYNNDTFDLVTSVFVIQHVSKANAIALLKESVRVLKPGGIFLHEFFGGDRCSPGNRVWDRE